jgi:hypothetical protein
MVAGTAGAAEVEELVVAAVSWPAGDGTPVSAPPRFMATAALPAVMLATTAATTAMELRVRFMKSPYGDAFLVLVRGR